MGLQPVPGSPAATADLDGERALVVADYHAGIEWALAVERGVEVDSRAKDRRASLCSLVDRTDPDRLVILGDLMHSIGDPGGREREEVEALLDALGELPVTLVKGNHDGAIEDWLPDLDVTSSEGVRMGEFGFAHGHTWPSSAVLGASVVCVGHEHPQVRLEDSVGGQRVERVWLRGPADMAPFARRDPDLSWLDHADRPGPDSDAIVSDRSNHAEFAWSDPELVVVPAFNELAGGTWINVEGQSFLAPFLPAAIPDGEAFLLDGTRLGPYESV